MSELNINYNQMIDNVITDKEQIIIQKMLKIQHIKMEIKMLEAIIENLKKTK